MKGANPQILCHAETALPVNGVARKGFISTRV